MAVGLVGRPVDAVAARAGGTPDVVMLIYHRVGGRTPSPVDLPTEAFTEQLDRLADGGRVVDLETAALLLRGEQASTGGPSVVLTFDDGTADWVDVVLPELVARRVPATFYVATDFVESRRPFPDDGRPVTWSGLAEMASTGLGTIGSHTHTHRVLAGASAATSVDEIERSVEMVEDRLGVECRHFAYPKAIAPSVAAEVVVRRRFATAVLAGNRPNVAGAADLHRLGRHALTTADDAAAFERKVRGGARLEGALRSMRDARSGVDGYDIA